RAQEPRRPAARLDRGAHEDDGEGVEIDPAPGEIGRKEDAAPVAHPRTWLPRRLGAPEEPRDRRQPRCSAYAARQLHEPPGELPPAPGGDVLGQAVVLGEGPELLEI